MQRAWFVKLSLTVLGGMTLAGCGGSGDDDPTAREPVATSGMLRPVRSAHELESLLKASLREIAKAGVPDVVSLPAASAFSGTYTVERGVDELDVVRFDGTHLYVAPVWLASPAYLPTPSYAVRILRTNAATGDATQVASVPIPSAQHVQGMYVANQRLVVLTSEAYFGPFGGLWSSQIVWAPSRLAVHVFDVANPAAPARVMSADIRGVFVASRRVGDQVVLVTRHTPHALVVPAQLARLDDLTLEELLPTITLDGDTRPLVDARRCYVTSDPDAAQRGHATLTTITTFPRANPRQFASVCYDEPSDGVYASQTALYVSQPRFDAATSATRIHKFALSDAAPRYSGSVEVPGTVWSGGQADFRMNEHDGLLRVMTTEWTQDPADLVDHRLFVLRDRGDELEIAGRLPSGARPEEIGKPNEGLFSVRFVGDRAYAVTFQRVDPLYVIDLSAPTDPRIAGELEIPGTSDLLHPVTDQLLLGIGRELNRVKVELFDVSLLDAPQSRGALFTDGVESWSDASRDHHAFTYLPAAAADRFTLSATGAYPTFLPPLHVQTALFQYEILGKQTAASASLQAAGTVLPPPMPGTSANVAGINRSFIHGDTVFYVRDGQVWSSPWHAPSQLQGPF
jgi:uncharacterized secreted protein with C-terminal beta-propeller domain